MDVRNGMWGESLGERMVRLASGVTVVGREDDSSPLLSQPSSNGTTSRRSKRLAGLPSAPRPFAGLRCLGSLGVSSAGVRGGMDLVHSLAYQFFSQACDFSLSSMAGGR